MSKKRPFASEGHLRLPERLAPESVAPESLTPESLAPGQDHLAARPPLAETEPVHPTVHPAVHPEVRNEPATRARLLERGPHAGDGRTVLAEVLDDALGSCGVRAGDRIVLLVGRPAEFGDVVALGDAENPALLTLWRARPSASGLRLRGERAQLDLPPDTPITGVLLAVLRPLRD